MVDCSMLGRSAGQPSHALKSRHVSMIAFGGIISAGLFSYGALATSVLSADRVDNFLLIAVAQLRLRSRLQPA